MQLTDLSFNRYKKAKPKGFVFFVLVSVGRRFPYTNGLVKCVFVWKYDKSFVTFIIQLVYIDKVISEVTSIVVGNLKG
ncbi:hypothetical protein ASE46_05990 [Bacillus sp. Root239]|nr:hypothetical protein ASE46_05990 [Bacillus sp. Root239]